jgi:alcohol dehydrogenase class IV
MHFEFATATHILFGAGRIREILSAGAALGRRALIVTGRTPARADSLIQDLHGQGIACKVFSVPGEPVIPGIAKGVETAHDGQCDFVIGFGGGSVLDAAKAIAALMTNPGDPSDYLEVIGAGKPLARPGAPCICVPTTAGTGSEVTRNAVLASPEHRVKVSLRSHWMLPVLAVVDPELTISMPPALTASTGLDALSQLIEPFVCNATTPMTDAFCRDGIRRVANSLKTAFSQGGNVEARENMALASLYGGLALANARLGAIHGLAAPLGGRFPISHGVVCARLLPFVMDANLSALHARAKDSPAVFRYREIARLLTGKPLVQPEEGTEWIHALCSELSIPGLSAFGVAENELPEIAVQAQKSSSMKGNPIGLTVEELTAILMKAL